MKNLVYKSCGAFALAALLLASVQAIAQQTVSEQTDGSMSVSVQGEQIVVPASVADAVAEAVAEHGDDPEALQEAIRNIIAEYAAASNDVALALAIAVLTISQVGSDSAAIASIITGTVAANNEVSAESIIEVMPSLSAEGGAQEDAEEQVAQLQATVENPFQVSPVQ